MKTHSLNIPRSYTVILVVFALTIFSCNKRTYDYETLGLFGGKVKSITIIEYNSTLEHGEWVAIDYLDSSVQKLNLNTNGFVSDASNYSLDWNLNYRLTFLNEGGQRIAERYDEQNNLLGKTYWRTYSKEEELSESFDNEGKLVVKFHNSRVSNEVDVDTAFLYAGLFDSPEYTPHTSVTTYFHNENDLVVKEEFFVLGEPEFIVESIIEYLDYDNNGNWLRRLTLSPNDTIMEVREIAYYE